jgi:hypothetical protein
VEVNFITPPTAISTFTPCRLAELLQCEEWRGIFHRNYAREVWNSLLSKLTPEQKRSDPNKRMFRVFASRLVEAYASASKDEVGPEILFLMWRIRDMKLHRLKARWCRSPQEGMPVAEVVEALIDVYGNALNISKGYLRTLFTQVCDEHKSLNLKDAKPAAIAGGGHTQSQITKAASSARIIMPDTFAAVQFFAVATAYRRQLIELTRYRESLAVHIYERYVRVGSPRQVNIPAKVQSAITAAMMNTDLDFSDHKLFVDAEKQILALMNSDSWPRFETSEIYADMLVDPTLYILPVIHGDVVPRGREQVIKRIAASKNRLRPSFDLELTPLSLPNITRQIMGAVSVMKQNDHSKKNTAPGDGFKTSEEI